MATQERLYLIDALPYVFRAFFAIRKMHSPAGDPVNAVYGFTTFLLQLLQRESPSHIGIAFDESLTSSFRNSFYPAYKANRELPPQDLARQLAQCQAIVRALGIPVFVDQQYEADDLIGTLARQAVQHGMEVVIVSNDKDLMQLVTPRVSFYDMARERRFDPAGVATHLGVQPAQIPDFLGLQGDAVDNIPGVQGIGSKTAIALLQTFPHLEALYTALERVETLPLRSAKTIRRKLENGREMAFVSRRLATIALDAPVTFAPEALRYHGAADAALATLCEALGFQGLGERLAAFLQQHRCGFRANNHRRGCC
ncbi:MAG: 5'-3' exonuclease H3TH domain-containing protein [Candidatus Tectimicrobiota bacterium]